MERRRVDGSNILNTLNTFGDRYICYGWRCGRSEQLPQTQAIRCLVSVNIYTRLAEPICLHHTKQALMYAIMFSRVDEITVAQGWKDLNDVAAEEGLVSIAYERNFKEHSRIYQFAKSYLYSPSAALYSCPLSMTGKNFILKVWGILTLWSLWLRPFFFLRWRCSCHWAIWLWWNETDLLPSSY